MKCNSSPVVISITIMMLVMVVLFPSLSSNLLAQPMAGKSQPDRLDVGVVRVGSTVEASVRIFEDGDDAGRVKSKVAPPDFVTVRNKTLGTQEYGRFGSKVFCDINLSIDTSRPGQFKGTMVAKVGKQTVSIPIRANVSPRRMISKRVLVVETPFDKFSTGDASLFDDWLKLVKDANLDCHYLDVVPKKPVLRDLDLSNFDVILLGETGLIRIQKPEIERLKKFMVRGGRVILSANAFYVGTVQKANQIASIHGLEMADTEPRGAGEIDLSREEITSHPLTRQVNRVKFFRPSPIAAIDSMNGKILVAAPSYEGQGYVAVGSVGKGEVILLGQSLWWNWIGKQRATDADNARLLRNLLTLPRQIRRSAR